MPTPMPTPNEIEVAKNWANANPGVLEAIAIAIAVGGPAFVFLLRWLVQRYKKSRLVGTTSESTSLAIYTDPDKLIRDLCPKANDADVLPAYSVPHQPRAEGRDIQKELGAKLNVDHFVLIKGPTGVGKTREAAELVRAKMRQGYRVVRVTSGWLDAPAQPLKELEGHRHVLLVIDDLNRLIPDSPKQPSDATEKPLFGFASFHERLQKLLDELERRVGNTLYVVATARDDDGEWEKITPNHPVWSRFKPFDLRAMSPGCYEAALLKIGEYADVPIVEADEITAECNLKPQTLVMNVRKAGGEGVALTPQNATPNEDRSHREEYERAFLANPAVQHVYAAVALLQQADIRPFTWLVEPSAGHVAGWNRRQRWRNKAAVRRALRVLPLEGARIQPRDGQIEAAQAQANWRDHVDFLHRLVLQQAPQRGKDIVSICMGFSVPLYESRDYVRAEALMRAAIAADPTFAGAHSNLGLLLKEQKRPDEAEAAYRAAISADPKDAGAHSNLGVLLSDLKRPDEAEAAYRAAIAADPKHAAAHYNLGLLLRDLKRPDEAEAAYRAAIAADPKLAAAHSNLGLLLSDLKRPDEAEAAYRAAIAADPKHAKAHSNLGVLLRDLKRPDEAEAAYRAAIAADPKDAGAHSNLGVLLRDLKRPDEAEAAYRAAIAADPKHAAAHYNLGLLLSDLKRPDEAEAAYRAAIAADPKLAQAHSNLGVLLSDLKRPDEAEAAYRAAIAADPKDARAHSNLGNLLSDLKRADEAEAAYRAAIAADPKHASAYNNLGLLLRQQVKVEDAISIYEALMALRPTHHDPPMALACLHKQLGHLDVSARYAEAARTLLPPNDDYNLACLESICGNVDASLEALRRAAMKDDFDADWARKDWDLQWVRDDPRFEEILQSAGSK